MKVNIRDERRIDYTAFEITLTKEDLANLIRYRSIRQDIETNYITINLEKDK